MFRLLTGQNKCPSIHITLVWPLCTTNYVKSRRWRSFLEEIGGWQGEICRNFFYWRCLANCQCRQLMGRALAVDGFFYNYTNIWSQGGAEASSTEVADDLEELNDFFRWWWLANCRCRQLMARALAVDGFFSCMCYVLTTGATGEMVHHEFLNDWWPSMCYVPSEMVHHEFWATDGQGIISNQALQLGDCNQPSCKQRIVDLLQHEDSGSFFFDSWQWPPNYIWDSGVFINVRKFIILACPPQEEDTNSSSGWDW